MDQNQAGVNGREEPLKNITLLSGLAQKLLDRPDHLPGIGCFSGWSGLGKSWAAAVVTRRYRAYYVEVRSQWTKKKLCSAILKQMGIKPATTVGDMIDQIGGQLALSRRLLIIDEIDYVVQRGMVDVIRDIYETSQGAIIIIGEEALPQKLVPWERFHGRIRDWVQAQPCDRADAASLAQLYCPAVALADDLLERLVRVTHGSTRRICVNLERVFDDAKARRLKAYTLADWGDREWFTGDPPKTRSF